MTAPVSFLYNRASQNFASKAWSWTADTWAIFLVASTYVAAPTDATLAAVTSGALVSPPIVLTGNAVGTNGILTANNPVWINLDATLPVAAALLVYGDGTVTTDPLVAYITGAGFGAEPTYQTTTLLWDATFGGLFKL